MHNLKEIKGTFKGLIGECLFKVTSNRIFLTRFHPKKVFINYYIKFLSQKQISFLELNWYSLDAVEYSYSDKKVIIYEVKTRNKYSVEIPYKPKATASSIQIYETAKSSGFVIKSVTVYLHDNWQYEVKIEDYSEKNYFIDRTKKYDKVFV